MSKRTYGHVLVLPSQRLMRPAADDNFVTCRNAHYGHVFVLPIRRLVHPAADDNFGIYRKSYLIYSILNSMVLN